MKVSKLTIVTFAVFLGISILLGALPKYQIDSLTASISTNPDIPAYKFTEQINLWKLYQVTAFEPAFRIIGIITIIIGVVLIAQFVYMNYNVKPKTEETEEP